MINANMETDMSTDTSPGSVGKFPALLGKEEQWLTDMEYIRKHHTEQVQISQFEKKEVEWLRRENSKLREQLELVTHHPLYDDQSERINVSMDLWESQKEKLKRMNYYKRLCLILGLSVVVLLVVLVRLLVAFI